MKKLFCLLTMILCGQLQAQNQQTLTFGATSHLPGATLVFQNASEYIADSGFCFPTVSGSYFDYNLGGDPGSYTYPYAGSTNLTWSVPVPSAGSTNLIRITEADNSPINDPYGLVQHSVFGFTQPGLYKLTWQLVDTSTNGPNGTPLNQPSAPFATYYQADCTIAGITCDAAGVHLRFAAPAGALQTNNSGFSNLEYNILQSPTLGPNANWSTVLDSESHYIIIPGDDHLHTNTLPPAGTTQFYRLFSYVPYVGT